MKEGWGREREERDGERGRERESEREEREGERGREREGEGERERYGTFHLECQVGPAS